MEKKINISQENLSSLIKEGVKKVISSLNENNIQYMEWKEISYKLDDLKERLGADILLDEIVGKMDQGNLIEIVNEIEGLYPENESEEEENEEF